MKTETIIGRRLLKFIMILFISSSTTWGQNDISNIKKIKQNLETLFEYCYQNELFNGSVAVIHRGKVAFKESYGFLDFNKNIEIDSDTQFLLASLSKQFTAMAVMLLQSKGKLEYDDKVSEYLPDFPYSTITIRQLLNHTSGIPEYTSLFNKQREQLAKRYHKTGEMVTNQSVANIINANKPELDFEPGTDFYYSNTGYVYLALLIERISKKRFPKFIQNNIFHPLGMKNSLVYTKEANLHKKAVGYKYDFDEGKFVLNETPPFFNVYGDGGIYSTINDLLKWDLALRTNKLINTNDLEVAYTNPNISNKPGPYGFGVFVRKLPFNGKKAVTHSGIFVGFTNSIFRELDNYNTTIVLSNNSHQINSEMNSAIVRILYGMPYKLPKLKGSTILLKIIMADGFEKAKTFYFNQKSNETYYFSEKQLNKLGYKLLENNKTAYAIEVFKWNIEANPESANVYDSLGETYLKEGENTLALKNYKIAFSKDPKNKRAKSIIEKLEKTK